MAYRRVPDWSPGCCLLSILYFPIGVILSLAKNYGGSSKRR